jgi:hypothetical protein
VKDFGLRLSRIASVSCFVLSFLVVFAFTANASGGPNPLTVSPSNVSFGNVLVGTSQAQSVVLANSGGSNLTISSVTLSGTGFTLSGLNYPVTLAGGQSVTCTLTFAPTSTGSDTGSVSISLNTQSNGGKHHGNFAQRDSTAVTVPAVGLSGTGVAPGQLATNPTSLSFGNIQVGTNQTQTETLTNSGGANLTISQATAIGAGFSVTGLSLPLTLVPNQSLTFGVAFAPTSAGAGNGSLSITTSGSNTSLAIALSGTGVMPAKLVPNPATLTFTNVQVGQSPVQTETVTNTGGSAAQISQVAASGTGFSVSGITTPVTLTPGQSTSFNVAFAPQSAGSFSGGISITSNASNPTLSETLSGSAVPQSQGTLSVSPVNVGSVMAGTSGTQTGTLSATGASVSVSSVSLGGSNPSEFSVSGLSFPVTVTTSQPVSFTVTFTPGSTGAASATASFASNGSSSLSATTLTGTGAAAPVHSVSLSWNASTSQGVTSYNVYRAVYGTSSCGSYSNIGSTASSITTYTDSLVTDGTTYCYATTAVGASGVSAYSNLVEAAIPAP